MKRNYKNISKAAFTFLFGVSVLTSCQNDPDSPGLEYFADMYRSPAVEAYVDYNNLTQSSVKTPPMGAVPYRGTGEDVSIFLPYKRKPGKGFDKSHGWYGYEQDATAYDSSALDYNPLKPTDANLENGKILYNKFCDHCHGEKGDGQGTIVQNGKIEGIPTFANVTKSEGQMFYSVTYGKGLMGAHASQLDKKERWQVVMYVKALQNGGKYEATSIVAPSDSTVVAADSTVADTANGGM